MLLRVPILQPLVTGGEGIFQYADGLKLVVNLCQTITKTIWSIGKLLHKDIIMAQFHCFNQTFEFE